MVAFVQVRLRLGFQELGRLPVFPQGDVVGSHGSIPVDTHSFQRLSAPEPFFHPVQQLPEFLFIRLGGMFLPDGGKGMGRGKGTGGKHPEVLFFQFIPEFSERAVIIPALIRSSTSKSGVRFPFS